MENTHFGFLYVVAGLGIAMITCINVMALVGIKALDEQIVQASIVSALKKFIYLCTIIVGLAILGWLSLGAGLVWKAVIQVTLS